MRKTQVALAALALVASSAALANGVTISGYMDVGVQNARNASTKMVGGLLAPNVVNFAGSEDLGNGLKGEFFLGTRFESPNGRLTTQGGAGTAGLFNLAYVGLSGEFGTVRLGRTVDSFWGNGAAAFDVTGGHNMGSFVGSVLTRGMSGVFVDNSVQYVAPNMGGLSVAGTYIAQADSGNTNNGAGCAGGACAANDYSVAATYATGALSVGGAYAKRGATNQGGKGYFLGAGYDAGFAKVNVVYLNSDNLGSASGVNANIPLVGALSANAGFYRHSGNTATNGNVTSVGANYALSKRTTVFANYQTTTGKAAINVGLSDNQASAATNSTAVTVGVGHSF